MIRVRLSWDEAKDLDDLKLLQQIFEEVTGKAVRPELLCGNG